MEHPESNYEGLFVIISLAIAFALTLITKRQREISRKHKKERQQMAKDLAQIKHKLE